MPAFSQQHRPLRIVTPLGEDVLLLEKLEGAEGISELFSFRLSLLAEKPIAFDQLLGKAVTVNVTPAGGKTRFIHGIVGRLTQEGSVRLADGKTVLLRYQAEVVPEAWLLSRNNQTRVFQRQSVPDILKTLFGSLDLAVRLVGSYPQRNYCVQYHESDFAFASRLMEEEGIFYFFEHSASSHTLVLSDGASHPALTDVGGPESVAYTDIEAGPNRGETITLWRKTQEVCIGKVSVADHHFQLPGSRLNTETALPQQSISAGTVAHAWRVAGSERVEQYEPAAGYARFFDGINKDGGEQPGQVQKIFEENQRTAHIRMQEAQARALGIDGAGDCRSFMPGYTFQLRSHFDGDGAYLLTRVEHRASVEGTFTSGTEPASLTYENHFRCIPQALAYRPPRRTPKPRTHGPMTAMVVGPAGEEIFCDKYGRIKVQFHWDRDGKNDSSSSCWLRVAQTWAGQGFGSVCIPRVGQAVLVDFIHGDPDQPVVVGSLYNAKNMPPYDLPSEATHQGFKTRSRNGSASNFNELRFEDTLGSEGLHLHAEKDMFHSAENSFYIKVGSTFGSGSGGGEDGSNGESSDSALHVEVPKYVGLTLGESTDITVGASTEVIAGGSFEIIAPIAAELIAGISLESLNGIGIAMLVGPQFEYVWGPYYETVWGTFTEMVFGNFLETVTGAFTEVVTGDFLELVNGDFVENVDGAFTEVVGGSFLEIVEGSFKEVVLGDFIEYVQGKQLELGEEKNHAVETNHSTAVSGSHATNVGADMELQALAGITLTSPVSITLQCGPNKIMLTPMGIFFSALNFEFEIKGRWSTTALQVQHQAIAMASTNYPMLMEQS